MVRYNMDRKRTWEKNHKMVWIDKELYEKVSALKIRDESVNSVIGYLYEFHKSHQPELGVVKHG